MKCLIAIMCLAQYPTPEPEIHLRFDPTHPVDTSWHSKITWRDQEKPANVHVHWEHWEPMAYKVGSQYQPWKELPRDAVPYPQFWPSFFTYLEATHNYQLEFDNYKLWHSMGNHGHWGTDKRRLKYAAIKALDENGIKGIQYPTVYQTYVAYYVGKHHFRKTFEEINLVVPPAIAAPAEPRPVPDDPREYLLVWK